MTMAAISIRRLGAWTAAAGRARSVTTVVVIRTAGGAETGSPSDAFGSVALERLTGFIALPLICVLGFAVNPGLLGEGRSWIALLAAGITVTALAVILVLAAHPRAHRRARWVRCEPLCGATRAADS